MACRTATGLGAVGGVGAAAVLSEGALVGFGPGLAIGGVLLDVISEGEFIPRGGSLRVIRHEGSRIVVESRREEEAES